MSKANRNRKPSRPEPFLDPKKRILVVSEGLTEKEYIDYYVLHRRAELVFAVDVKVEGQAGVPMTVVARAKELKKDGSKRAANEQDENLEFDSVWAVFDVDEHPRVGEAMVMARDNGINCAVSNACFELWLYLHFEESPGMQDRIKLRRFLKDIVPAYNKHIDFNHYKENVHRAVSRAKKLDQLADAAGEAGRNPTTGMWMIIDSIDKNNSTL